METVDMSDMATQPRMQVPAKSAQRSGFWQRVASLLMTWEIYPVVAVAFFLHFYQLSASQFDADQAILFRLPRAAVVFGLIPATGTVASIGMINPPGYVYLLMPVAAFTGSPWWDYVFTASLNALAVVLTYVFTRRYYGRVAGTVAALLFGATFWDLYFTRFIWQPNLFPFFTLLFMLALFRGAVERKSGWLAVALPLLGFTIQLHTVAIYLVPPLVLTLVLAYKTVRWRDVVIGVIGFCLFFVTYFIWEISTNFADISILLHSSGGMAQIDKQALIFYANFLKPYVPSTINPLPGGHSLLVQLQPLLHWEQLAMYAVLLGGFLIAGLGLLGWKEIRLTVRSRFATEPTPVSVDPSLSLWRSLLNWWSAFAASPQRCGLLLLLSWQILPVLWMTRHALSLQPQYFLVLLPGPFILIGLLVSQVTSWCGQVPNLGRFLRLTVPALSLLLVILQFTGSFAWFSDDARGAYVHGYEYDTWQDVQGAVDAADQLAQSHHFHHVYIYTNTYTYETLHYQAWQMQTPVTVLSPSNCLVLPSLAEGPAVVLMGPEGSMPLSTALLNHFATATLVSQPSRPGGSPFQLYIVQPMSAAQNNQESFTGALALDEHQPGAFTWNDPNNPGQPTSYLFETAWTNLSSSSFAYETMHTYHIDMHYAGNGTDGKDNYAECSFSNIAPGEQLLVPLNLPKGSAGLPTSVSMSGSTWASQPDVFSYGPFRFESILDKNSLATAFQTLSGGNSLVIRV